jgi:tRNA A37 threonylcarbamoyladenosine dehydratase
MGQRLHQISPLADIREIDAFVEPDNVAALVPAQADVVIDAIDAVAAKAALVAWCVRHDVAVVTCGAAGGRTDPLRLQCEDLARTSGDSLLSSLRARLRRSYGFAAAAGITNRDLARARRFGVPAIFSAEPRSGTGPRDGGTEAEGGRGGAPLACAGYGSIVTVTAAMGFAAASRAIDLVLQQPVRQPSTPSAAP